MTEWMTLNDLLYLFHRRKKALWMVFGIAFCLGLGLFTFRAPTYLAQAQFQDTPSSSGSLKEKIAGKGQSPSTPFYKGKAYIWMQSSTLLERIIRRDGLQVSIKPKNLVRRFYNRFEAHFFPQRNLSRQLILTHIRNVRYEGMHPFYFRVKGIDKDHVEINGKRFVVPGPIDMGDIAFDMESSFTGSLELAIDPLYKSVVKLKRDLKLSTTQVDPNVIEMRITRSSPLGAEQTLNAIMNEYRVMLSEDLTKMVEGQMNYLTKRKGDLFEQFEGTMGAHVDHFQENIQSHGFMTTAEWIAQKGALDTRFEERLQKLSEQIESAKFAKDANILMPPDNGLWSRAYELQTKKEGVSLAHAEQLVNKLSEQARVIQEQRIQLKTLSKEVLEPDFDFATLEKNEIVARAIALQTKLSRSELLSENEITRATDELQSVRKRVQGQLVQRYNLLESDLKECHTQLQNAKKEYTGQLSKEEEALEKQNNALLNDRIGQIESEITFLEQKRNDYQNELKHIPEQWMSETLLKLKSDLHYSTLESLASFVEAKSIQHHLIPVEVRPIEWGFALKKPYNFFPLISSFLSAIAVVFVAMCFIVVRALMRGIPISSETLKKLGANVCGSLADPALVARFLSHRVQNAKVIGLFQADANYVEELESVFSTRNESVLVVDDFTFSKKGLEFSESYDRILIATSLTPIDPEVAFAMDNFDVTIFTLRDESVADIESLIEKGLFVYQP